MRGHNIGLFQVVNCMPSIMLVPVLLYFFLVCAHPWCLLLVMCLYAYILLIMCLYAYILLVMSWYVYYLCVMSWYVCILLVFPVHDSFRAILPILTTIHVILDTFFHSWLQSTIIAFLSFVASIYHNRLPFILGFNLP